MKLDDMLRNFKSVDDKVAAVLYESTLRKIPTDINILHSAFYRLSNEYPDFFNELLFKKGEISPYSESLDQTFPGLAISGFISCENPEYEYYNIDDEKRTKIEKKILTLFSEREKKQIKEIGSKLKTYIEQ